jgi:hypothetical protein
MKCPKCGYNSFEGYDVCIKCSRDLTTHKATYGLKPIVLQMETRVAMAAALAAETVSAAAAVPPPEQTVDMFSFDLPDEEPAATAKEEAVKEDFFSFGEKTTAPPPSELFNAFSFDNDQAADKNKSEGDAFSSLLESTQHGDTFPPAAPETTPSTSTPDNSQGEYELNSFSWDETPEISESDDKKPVDNFKSLFGGIDGDVKK